MTDPAAVRSEPVLQGYVIEAILGSQHLDVSLIASSEHYAISRVRGILTHSRRNIGWLKAEYIVAETMSLAEFKIRRVEGRA